MPKINRVLIRSWLEKHNWTVERLTDECNSITDELIPFNTMRNVVNGIDSMRPGRIRVICAVTAAQGDAIKYAELVVDPPDERDKDLLNQLREVYRRLNNVDQLLSAKLEARNERLMLDLMRDLSFGLMASAEAMMKLGIDMAWQTSAIDRSINSVVHSQDI